MSMLSAGNTGAQFAIARYLTWPALPCLEGTLRARLGLSTGTLGATFTQKGAAVRWDRVRYLLYSASRRRLRELERRDTFAQRLRHRAREATLLTWNLKVDDPCRRGIVLYAYVT